MVHPTPEQLRELLAEAGRDFADLEIVKARLQARIGILLREGFAAGLDIADMARLVGWTRPTVYRYLRQSHDSPPD